MADVAAAREAQATATAAYNSDPYSGAARARAARADRELAAALAASGLPAEASAGRELWPKYHQQETDENEPPAADANAVAAADDADGAFAESLAEAQFEERRAKRAAKAAEWANPEYEPEQEDYSNVEQRPDSERPDFVRGEPVLEQFRLFVTGWPPSLGADAVVDKLRSFGRVEGEAVVSNRKPLGGGGATFEGAPFAHVTLETDHNKMTKCIKALNGSMWMDSKLVVTWAKEHYTERIIREAWEAANPEEAQANYEEEWGIEKPKPITRLRIADPSLPRRRRKRSQVIVDLAASNRPGKIRFDDAGDPIGSSSGFTQRPPSSAASTRSVVDEAAFAADAAANLYNSDDEAQVADKPLEPVDVSTDAGIRRMLIEQGFIDDSDDDDVQPAPSATGNVARGEDAGEDGVDVVKETDDSMKVLSSLFAETNAEKQTKQDPADLAEQRKAGPGGLSGLYWFDVPRYNPNADNAAELELDGEVMAGGAKGAQLSAAPDVSVGYHSTTGSIADLFTKSDPGAAEDSSLPLQGGAAEAEAAALQAAAAAGEEGLLAGAAMLEAQRPKFTLLGMGSDDAAGCRFMRTETAEEVQSQWKAERELYTLDYKKRRKDALRRQTSRSRGSSGGGGRGGGRGRGGGGRGGGQ